MILSDIVPNYYRKSKEKFGRPTSLNGVKKKVLKELSLLEVTPQSRTSENPLGAL